MFPDGVFTMETATKFTVYLRMTPLRSVGGFHLTTAEKDVIVLLSTGGGSGTSPGTRRKN